MITEQEVREKMDAALKEKLHPIVEQMTNLIGKAYTPSKHCAKRRLRL